MRKETRRLCVFRRAWVWLFLVHFLLITRERKDHETDMKVICSWCCGEGRLGLVGEKAPLDDRRETHGICGDHQRAMRNENEHRGSAQAFDGYDINGDRRCESGILTG